jgi:hypothetical protein
MTARIYAISVFVCCHRNIMRGTGEQDREPGDDGDQTETNRQAIPASLRVGHPVISALEQVFD